MVVGLKACTKAGTLFKDRNLAVLKFILPSHMTSFFGGICALQQSTLKTTAPSTSATLFHQLIHHIIYNLLITQQHYSIAYMRRNRLHPKNNSRHTQPFPKIRLIESAHSVTFGGFIDTKVEEVDPDDALFEEIDAVAEEMDQTQFIQSLEVDKCLISVMMARSSLGSPPVNSMLVPTTADDSTFQPANPVQASSSSSLS